MDPRAVAQLDLESPRGLYSAIQGLRSEGYEDLSLLFDFDEDKDQLMMNDFGRPYLAFGRHDPRFREASLFNAMGGFLTGYLSILSLGLIPTVWSEPATTHVTVYDRELNIVSNVRFEHGTLAFSAIWAFGENLDLPPITAGPYAGTSTHKLLQFKVTETLLVFKNLCW